MPEACYRTGQAARVLHVSSYQIRRLAEAGLINSEFTGKQWRIPASEVERLSKEGVPEVPASTKPNEAANGHGAPGPPASAKPRYGHPALLDEPSEDAVAAADEVVTLESEVKALELKRRKEEQLDWFRQRNAEEAEQIARQEEAEKRRRSAEEAQRQRKEGLESWERYALNSVPHDAPPDVRLELHLAVRNRLSKLDPLPPYDVAERLVDGEVEKAVGRWNRTKQIEKIIEDAVDGLPAYARSLFKPTKWQITATQDARQAVVEVGHGAPLTEIEFAVSRAVERVTAEYEHQKKCHEFMRDAWMWLRGETPQERDQARLAVAESLSQLAVGATQKQFESARETALEPLRQQIARREEQARRERVRQQDQIMRQDVIVRVALPWDLPADERQRAIASAQKAIDELPEGTSRGELEQVGDQVVGPFLAAHTMRQEAARRKSEAESRIRCLSAVGSANPIYCYLRELERREEIAFRDSEDFWDTNKKMQERVISLLFNEVLQNPKLSDEQIEKRAQELTRKHLDEFLDAA